MSQETDVIPPPAGSNESGLTPLVAAVALLQQGAFAKAEALIHAALAENPRSERAQYLLGYSYQLQSRLDDAIACYRCTIELAPKFAEAHNNLGVAFEAQSDLDRALACYRTAIDLRRNYAEAHNNAGNVLRTTGHLVEAVAAYEAAIAARPNYPEAYFNLANALTLLARCEEAIAAHTQAIALRPQFFHALNNLSILLLEAGRFEDAAVRSRQAIAVEPQAAECYYNLGRAMLGAGQPAEALAAYERAAVLRPSDAEAYVGLGNACVALDRLSEAYPHFRRAHDLRPLTVRRATEPKLDFSALIFDAPGVGNTPGDYLLAGAPYDCNFMFFLPDVVYDVEKLRKSGDIVVNLISDADSGRAVLPRVAKLVDEIGLPVINHPRRILGTGREEIAKGLVGIPRCRVPKTIRIDGAVLLSPDGARALRDFAFPLLLRVSGTHSGDDFEKLADGAAVTACVSRNPGATYYASEFVPYQSADGYYRKYRFIFTNGQVFPYHLAIHDDWKVHHFRTRMAEEEWMRREEEAFLADPIGVFGPEQWQALQDIQAAVSLDYCGIDCSLDRDGNFVVFEVNATMLIHGETGIFAYKEPHVARIRAGFVTMLTRLARGHRRKGAQPQ